MLFLGAHTVGPRMPAAKITGAAEVVSGPTRPSLTAFAGGSGFISRVAL